MWQAITRTATVFGAALLAFVVYVAVYIVLSWIEQWFDDVFGPVPKEMDRP